MKYLGRHIFWTNKWVTIEADQKHVGQLLCDLDMLECYLVNTLAATGSEDVRGELSGIVQAKL